MNKLTQNAVEINTNKTLSPEEACLDYMREKGLPFPPDKKLLLNGRFDRYSADEKPSKKDEWYIGAYDGEDLIVTFGTFTPFEKFTFCSFANDEIDNDEKLKRQIKREIHEKEANRQLTLLHNKAAETATNIFNRSSLQATEELLGYPKLKQINPIGVRFFHDTYKSAIVVPIRDCWGKLWSLQYIFWDEKEETPKYVKRFMPGGKMQGNFHTVNDETIVEGSIIYVCEGWATGVSIYNAIKADNVFVVCAMSMNAIARVIEELKIKFSQCTYIIAADAGDKERIAAEKAAMKFGCFVTYPDCTQGKDFNDVQVQYGLYTVKEQLNKIIPFESEIERASQLAKKILMKEDPCADFKIESMPPVLKDLVESICSNTAAHQLSILGSLLTTASAFINKKYYIPEITFEEDGYFQRLYCNLWIIAVAPSGLFKSTALSKGARLAFEKSESVCNSIDKAREAVKIQSDPKVKKQLKEDLEDLELSISTQDVLLPNRMSPEALLEYMALGHNGAIYCNEIGGFIKNLQKPGNYDMMAIFTEIFDCPSVYRYKTRTQGDHALRYPFISIFGVSTLRWLNDALSEKDVFGGFYPRFLLFSLPEPKEIPPALPQRRQTTSHMPYFRFKEILKNLDPHRKYWLDEDAITRYNEVYETIRKIYETFDADMKDIFAPYVSRWNPYVLKLALIMQVFIDDKSNMITKEAIDCAFSFMLPAIKSTLSLFSSGLGESEFARSCSKIYEFICNRALKKEKVTFRCISKNCNAMKNIGSEKIKEYLQKLIDSGKIEEIKAKNYSDFEYKLIG